jgi:hypothetical protein
VGATCRGRSGTPLSGWRPRLWCLASPGLLGVLMSRPACPPEDSPLLIRLSSPFVHAPVEMPIKSNQIQSNPMRVRVDAQGSRRPFKGAYVCGVFALQQLDGGHLHSPLSYAARLKTQTAFGICPKVERWEFPQELHQIPIAHNCRQLRFYQGPELSTPELSALLVHTEHPARTHDVPACKPPKDPAETAPDCIRTCLRGEAWLISLNPVAARAGKQAHKIIIEFG